jgi:hypothetical protein
MRIARVARAKSFWNSRAISRILSPNLSVSRGGLGRERKTGCRFFALVREYTHSGHVCAEVLIASGELEESGELQRFAGLACMRLEPAAWGMIRRNS